MFAGDILAEAAATQGSPITWGADGIPMGFGEAEIRGYDGFGNFVKAVEAAGLADTLKGAGPFTVFAPVDSAFPEDMTALLADPAALAEILKYHVVAGKVSSGSIAPGEIATVNGASITVTRRFRKNFLDYAMMDPKFPADVDCSNGVFHAIDSIMIPGDYNPINPEAGKAGAR